MYVFITTCAMNKEGGGFPYSQFKWSYPKKFELIGVRKKVLQIMKSSQKKPVEGPDFEGKDWGGKYLPAFRRYSQGAFVEGLRCSGVDLDDWSKRNKLFFISALYGLVHFQEPIQNYDLDMSEEVRAEWKDSRAITKALVNYLNPKKKNIDCVIDCCSSYLYSDLIDWDQLKGIEVRHAVSVGNFQSRQVRWSCGYLAGLEEEVLLKLLTDENENYHTDNAVIRLVEDLIKPEKRKEKISSEYLKNLIHNKYVVVACLRDSQYDRFLKYAIEQGWDKYVEFHKTTRLDKDKLHMLDKGGFKNLIAHVDGTHAEIRKIYGIKGEDISDVLPKGWQCYKVTHNDYSDIKFELKLILSKRGKNE